MFLHEPIVQLILATPVQFVIGWCFYVGAYHALRNKSANMDVLVALGTSVSFQIIDLMVCFYAPGSKDHLPSRNKGENVS